MMLETEVNRDEVHFGASITVRFLRTLRVSDDGREYPSLPTFGGLEIYAVRDYADRVPAAWRVPPGVFVPLRQQEAMVISLAGRSWKPNAVKVGIGKLNALTGTSWHEKLISKPQNYLVCPQQCLLSGFRDRARHFRQFATLLDPKGRLFGADSAEGGTCEGMQIMVFEPRPGLFRDYPQASRARRSGDLPRRRAGQSEAVAFRHELLPDPYGIQTWDPLNFGRVCVHIVSDAAFREITGQESPASPIHRNHYAKVGLPRPGSCEEGAPIRCG